MPKVQTVDQTDIEDVVEAKEEAPKETPKENPEARVKVTIASDPNDPCGNVDVVLGVNGYVVRVKRDTPVMLKRKFLGPLRDAVKKVYDVGDNGEITRERLIPRFNYTIHG